MNNFIYDVDNFHHKYKINQFHMKKKFVMNEFYIIIFNLSKITLMSIIFQDYKYNLFENDYSYLLFDFNFYDLIFL